jgi:hypothetical protein
VPSQADYKRRRLPPQCCSFFPPFSSTTSHWSAGSPGSYLSQRVPSSTQDIPTYEDFGQPYLMDDSESKLANAEFRHALKIFKNNYPKEAKDLLKNVERFAGRRSNLRLLQEDAKVLYSVTKAIIACNQWLKDTQPLEFERKINICTAALQVSNGFSLVCAAPPNQL